MNWLKLLPQAFSALKDFNSSDKWYTHAQVWTLVLSVAAYYIVKQTGYQMTADDTQTALAAILALMGIFGTGKFKLPFGKQPATGGTVKGIVDPATGKFTVTEDDRQGVQ